MGGLSVESSKVWLSEIIVILVEHTSVLTPNGGPSIKLGVDDISTFVMHVLHWRNNEAVISLA
eukprot:5381671-Prymnesium_polylepis.1